MKIGAGNYGPVSKKFVKDNLNPECYADITFSKSQLDSTVSNEQPDQELLKSPNLYVYSKNVSPETLIAAARGEVVKRLQTQATLKDITGSKTQLGTVVVWLDVIQQEIMKDPAKRKVIVGPASTGKTLLIQLKVLEIIESGKDNVLIILPLQQLVEKYKEFFKKATNIDMSNRVRFCTAEIEDWEGLLGKNKTSHWFIDEFAALHAGYKELSNQILKLSR